MIGYTRFQWVCKASTGYAVIPSDHIASFDAPLERATRFDSPRMAKNAVLAATTLEVRNGRTAPVIVYERIKETVEIDYVEAGIWDAHERSVRLLAIMEVSRAVAEAYQWVMTSSDLDYTEWTCAAQLPEWEFTDPDAETVKERLEGINMPCVISKNIVFVRREDDYAALRMLFDDIRLFVSLEDATVLMENRS